MIKLIANEFLKLKKLGLILALLIIPLLSVIFGNINYYANRAMLKDEWVSLWTQVYLIYGLIFLPVLAGLIVSYLWHTEHKNVGLKLILTSPVNPSKIILAKITTSFLVIGLTQLYFWLLYAISGQIYGFTSSIPYVLLLYLGLITIFLLAFISFQAYISIKIHSLVLPVAVALALSLFSLLLAAQNLIPILQNIYAPTRLTLTMNHYPETYITTTDWIFMGIFSIVIFGLFYILQNKGIKKDFQ